MKIETGIYLMGIKVRHLILIPVAQFFMARGIKTVE